MPTVEYALCIYIYPFFVYLCIYLFIYRFIRIHGTVNDSLRSYFICVCLECNVLFTQSRRKSLLQPVVVYCLFHE